jgi:hypothetical protein
VCGGSGHGIDVTRAGVTRFTRPGARSRLLLPQPSDPLDTTKTASSARRS